jgi:uncharacterized protein
VVFFSMASSSGAEAPRNVEFLYSRNRLNVAVSRARCLAVLVCSSRLLHLKPSTVAHARLVNALCRFVELATSGGAGRPEASNARGPRLDEMRVRSKASRATSRQ